MAFANMILDGSVANLKEEDFDELLNGIGTEDDAIDKIVAKSKIVNKDEK
jgi:hypothetical protein